MTAPPTLLHVFSTFKVGGPQVRFAQLANKFGRSFRHRLFAMDGAYACRERLDHGLDIQIVDVPVLKGRTLANVRSFRRTLRALQPDLLVTYNWGAIEWAMANWPRLLPHVHIEDGFGPEEATGQLRRRVWTRRLFLAHSTIVLPSRTLMRIASDVWRMDPSRLLYIPNGINWARFSSQLTSNANPTLPWAGNDPVIGTVAAVRGEKNLSRLLRAVHRISRERPCNLVIVGDGPERPTLEALAEDLDMTQTTLFTGHVPDPHGYYQLFDVFALSSDTEQMPYSVLEAMASGLAIAATNVGDVSDMVSTENRPFVVPPDDEAFAKCLYALLQDGDSRSRIGMANRKKAKQDYDEKAMFMAYEALFLGGREEKRRAAVDIDVQ